MAAPVTTKSGVRLSEVDARELPRRVRVRVYLHTFAVWLKLAQCEPEDRFEILRRRASRWLRRLRDLTPSTQWQIESSGGHGIPTDLAFTASPKTVLAIARLPGVRQIEILTRLHQRPRRTRRLSWFCVQERIAVQVESQRRGLQKVEERFLLVRAATQRAAEKKAIAESRRYGQPYLNSDGLLVRWQLEEILKIERIYDETLNPNGTEVFSELSDRRIHKAHQWPAVRRRANQRLRPATPSAIIGRRG